MAQRFLDDLNGLLAPVLAGHAAAETIVCKHFFSGAAAYVGDAVFMTLTPVGLALKLPKAERERLLGQGAKPLKYFPKAPVTKDYVVLSGNLAGNPETLANWISSSIAHVTRGRVG